MEILTHVTHINCWEPAVYESEFSLHESEFSCVLRIEFIRSKLPNLSAHVSEVSVEPRWAVFRSRRPRLNNSGAASVPASNLCR